MKSYCVFANDGIEFTMQHFSKFLGKHIIWV